MIQRKALGKGLGSLIPVGAGDGSKVQVSELPIELVQPSEFQPRKEFHQKNLESLARSIKEKGVMQPVIVRKKDSGYELIAGERRWRASQMAGFTRIPVIVKDTTDEESLEIALIENIQREDLNPLEEAKAYQMLLEKFNLTQEEVSKRVGKERSTIANFLRLLNLPDYLKDDLVANRLSMGHARALLGVSSASFQKILRDQIISKELSVREVEKLINSNKKEKKIDKPIEKDVFRENIEEELQKKIGTRVKIKKGKKGGRLEIFFFSDQELDRILELFH